MAFYIILKSDKQIKYTLVGASPYFYSPTFQKNGRALLFPPTCTGGGGRRTTTLMEKSMMLEMNL